MLSLHKISVDPDREISSFILELIEEDGDITTVLDAYIDHDIIVMMVASETYGCRIEIVNFSTKSSTVFDVGALSDLRPLRFHYHNGLICVGTRNAIT